MYIFLNVVIYLVVFFMGASMFSFLNTVINDKNSENYNILSKHACCVLCGHEQKTIDAFPIVSWIIFKGKCRYCKENLPKRGLILELLGGILAAALTAIFWIHLITLIIFLGVFAVVYFVLTRIK